MPRSVMYDPGTMEARVQWLAGLTEICNKLSGVLDMKTGTFEDLTLPEVYISETDRCRIYQAPLGNKLWLQTPTPVIKKNGVVITPENDGFEIDLLGGSIAFNEEYTCEETDVITASATYIIDGSKVISDILSNLNDLSTKTGSFQGSFDTLADLVSAVEVGEAGYYAIVQNESTIYVWNTERQIWVDVHKQVDLTNYYDKDQTESLLDDKQNLIPSPTGSGNKDSYYYSGSKTWVGILEKVLGAVLVGVVDTDSSKVTDTDTLLIAIGKLQAQINENLHEIYGDSEPSESLVGEIGQDYIDRSSGNKFHLVEIDTSGTTTKYIWEQYASESDIDTLDTKLTNSISSTDTSLRAYVDTSIQNSIYSSWGASY